MADTKPGKVVRVSPKVWEYLKTKRKPKETIDSLIRRLIGFPNKKGEPNSVNTYFILPETKIVCDSVEEARGKAILFAIKNGKKKPTEKPVRVREVI